MSRKTQALLLIIALLFAAGREAWAMGQKMDVFVPVDALVEEKRYTEAIDMLRGLLVSAPAKTAAIKDRIAKTQLLLADQAIDAQRYNEAMAALSLFWAQNPERADEAQSRIRRINKAREDYNKKAKELLAFMSDSGNRANADYNLEVTRRLEELDALDRNNPDSRKTIISLKETSLALVNQDSMKAVMSQARKSIDSGDYVKATRDYLKGFSLFKPEFEDAGYDELTMQAVAKLVGEAQAAPSAYEAQQAELKRAEAELESAFRSGKPQAISQAQVPAEAALESLRLLRQSVFETGSAMSRSYDALPKAGKSPIEYQYLAYLDIFTRGRPDSFGEDKKPAAEKGLPEGIGGALLSQTESILERLQKAAEEAVDSAYAAAEKDFDSGAYEKAGGEFDRARELVAPAAKLLANWSRMPEGDFVPELAGVKAKIAAGAAAASRLASLGDLAASSATIARASASYAAAAAAEAAYVAGLGPGGGVAIKDARTVIGGYRQAIAKAEAAIAAEARLAQRLEADSEGAAAAVGDDRPRTAYAAYAGRLGSAAAAALAAEYAVAASGGRVEGDYIGRELGLREAAVAAAEAAAAGALSTRPERAKAGYKDPSPTAASAALAEESARIAALSSWVKADLASMDAEPEGLRADRAFAAARDGIADLGSRTAALEARRTASLAAALEQKKKAAAILAKALEDSSEAQARLADAKDLIERDRGKGTKSSVIKKAFADARSRLDSGLRGIIESSGLDFFADSWDKAQRSYASLSADLAQTRKDYTVYETFRLLGEGQTYYDQALFDLASESLSSAQELWREENDSDQSQVKYWQNLVKQASDTNNKREVKQSDAMYYEIGGYLSEARSYYLKGDNLVRLGRKNEASAAFDKARQSLSFVTRAFPLNAEAGLLTLQILKSTDADAYKKSLPRRIQEATALLETDASSGYSRIADLYKMDPNYPGLKAILEKAEIKVGKRRAPPTREELANAASLVAQAENLLKSGRKDDATKAESSLNAALTYDPTSKRALALLRDLKTLQGKTAGPTLGLADQAVLDQATRSFAARSYNQARDQLAELLADPNKRTREVLKLDNDLKTLGY